MKPGLAGRSATRRAQAWANSFGLPTTKVSKVKRASSGTTQSERGSGVRNSGGRGGGARLSARPGARRAAGPRPRHRRARRWRPGCRQPVAGSLGDADLDPADGAVLGLPQRAQAVAVMAVHPVAQEARRQQDHRLRHHRCHAGSSAAARCGTRPRRPRHAGARGCGPSRRPSVRTSLGAIRRPPSAPNACRRADTPNQPARSTGSAAGCQDNRMRAVSGDTCPPPWPADATPEAKWAQIVTRRN